MVGQIPTSAKSLNELMARTLQPAVRKRGLARVEILAWWPEIVGAAYASLTRPHSIKWPRATGDAVAVLVVRCDPSIALHLAHERSAVRDRLNNFLGYPAIGEIRLVQHPLARPQEQETPVSEPDPQVMDTLKQRLDGLEPGLRDALLAFGSAVLARS